MDSVQYTENKIVLDSQELEFETQIRNVEEYEGMLLVLFDTGKMDPRNVVAYDLEGTLLWRIDPLKKSEEDTPRPINGIDLTDDYVQVRDFHQDRYKVDVETGEVEYLGWSR